ncbi:hypothetical protein ACHAWF_002486 [Thalassiosira exigua]
MANNPPRPSPAASLALLAATAASLGSIPAGVSGWIPRFSTSRGGRAAGAGRLPPGRRDECAPSRTSSLAASEASAEDADEDGSDGRRSDRRSRRDERMEPLFAEGSGVHGYMISRLEALYDLDPAELRSDIASAAAADGGSEERRRLLLEGGDRVVLGDWMEWEEGTCVGDKCGDDPEQCTIPDEYKVATPKVDVMSFLGIKRAEPLRVHRDWD